MVSTKRIFLSLALFLFWDVSDVHAASKNVEQAKKAEAEAFRAVESESWCDALHLFVFAHQAAPSLDLIWNAAQAADLAKDRKEALKLYVELLGAYPNSERETHVRERIGVLTQEVAEVGRGVACPMPAVIEKLKKTDETEATSPASTTNTKSGPQTDVSSVETETGASLSVDADGSVKPYLPYATLAAGLGTALVGGALVALGTAPYLEFMSARDAILEAERNQTSAESFHASQTNGRENWEGWGAATVSVGGVMLATGVVAAIFGGVWVAGMGDEPKDMESMP